MDGLYAVLDHSTRRVLICPFPYGLTAGRKAARRLRRTDPPHDVLVPTNPLRTIAPDDRIAAYHFMLRAVRAMLDERNHQAVPYLMAFSGLARVRFAYVNAIPEPTGLTLDVAVVEATDYAAVHHLFTNPADQ